MKNLSFLAVLFLTINCGLLTAQTNKGDVLIGVSSTLSLAGTGSDLMSLGYSTVKAKSDADGYLEPDPYKRTNINLLPKIGYFVIDNLAIGLDVNIALSTTKYGGDNDKSKYNLFSVGPFIRYYIPTSKVLPFFELNSSFGNLKSIYESTDLNDEDKSSVRSFGGGFGIATPIGDKVTFDLLIEYSSLTVKEIENNEDNYRTTIGTLGLKLGFVFFL